MVKVSCATSATCSHQLDLQKETIQSLARSNACAAHFRYKTDQTKPAQAHLSLQSFLFAPKGHTGQLGAAWRCLNLHA